MEKELARLRAVAKAAAALWAKSSECGHVNHDSNEVDALAGALNALEDGDSGKWPEPVMMQVCGPASTLEDCPPGPFRTQDGGVGFKSEYPAMVTVPESRASGKGADLRWTVGTAPDVYVLNSGESWADKGAMVLPLEVTP